MIRTRSLNEGFVLGLSLRGKWRCLYVTFLKETWPHSSKFLLWFTIDVQPLIIDTLDSAADMKYRSSYLLKVFHKNHSRRNVVTNALALYDK